MRSLAHGLLLVVVSLVIGVIMALSLMQGMDKRDLEQLRLRQLQRQAVLDELQQNYR